ncbi:MAG: T9SS type A sorting domain-containing protein [Bacteroidota bacterium]
MTASELNNDHFTVYKSDDGGFFYEIGTVDGAGTTSASNRYSLIDYAAKGLSKYYKLVQTDFDGTQTTYGPIRSPMCQSAVGFQANAYQSSNNEMVVTLDNPYPSKIKIDILSLDGKLVATHQGPYDTGQHLITLNANGFATGIYMVRIQCDNEVITVKTPFRNLF